MRRLQGRVQHYDWGSHTALPAFTQSRSDGRPWAEIWYGAHYRAPSLASHPAPWVDGEVEAPAIAPVALDKYLGTAMATGPADGAAEGSQEEVSPLPFLAKLLSAERALSLQVHPSAEQAHEGFARQEARGVAAEERIYADRMHKPETLIALVSTKALVGFREPVAIARDYARLACPALDGVIALLSGARLEEAFREILAFDASRLSEALDAISRVPASHALLTPPTAAEWANAGRGSHEYARRASVPGEEPRQISPTYTELDNLAIARELLEQYPGDVGVLGSLFLHAIELLPGQALTIDAGVLHGYLVGGGLEVMANSDNVMRAGLTHKHVAVDELLRILRFDAARPVVEAPAISVTGTAITGWRTLEYPAHFSEFSTSSYEVYGHPTQLTVGSDVPGVIVGLAGAVVVESGDGRISMAPGDAVFLSASEHVSIEGDSGTVAYIRPRPGGAPSR